jgi:hypothetical protein
MGEQSKKKGTKWEAIVGGATAPPLRSPHPSFFQQSGASLGGAIAPAIRYPNVGSTIIVPFFFLTSSHFCFQISSDLISFHIGCLKRVLGKSEWFEPPLPRSILFGPPTFELFFSKTKSDTMPQLDSFTYLTQVVWLCVFLFSYYLLLLNNALPRISRVLKLRKQLTAGSALTESQADATTLTAQGSASIPSLTSRIVWDVCRLSQEFLSQTVQYSLDWYNQQLSNIHKGQFQKIHKASVAFLGQLSLWQVLTSQILSSGKALPIANKSQSKQSAFVNRTKRCFSNQFKRTASTKGAAKRTKGRSQGPLGGGSLGGKLKK